MSRVPLTDFDGYRKRIDTSTWDGRLAELFGYLFPVFSDVRPQTVVEAAEQGTTAAIFEQVFSPLVKVEQADRRQPRRFAGPSLPRHRYSAVCFDQTGYDHNTLVHELRAYRDPVRSGMVEVVDLGIGTVTIQVGDQAIKISQQTAIGALVHDVGRVPGVLRDLATDRVDNADGSSLVVYRFPYILAREQISGVIDLRLPATREWFHAYFSQPRPADGIMWPPDSPSNLVPTSTVAVTRFHSFEGRAPIPADFYGMLPTLLNPSLGGGRESSTGSTVQAIGSWMRNNGVSALVYPSARANAFVEIKHGELTGYGGWNLVDYRGTTDSEIKMIYYDHSPWCWVGVPKGVSTHVTPPGSDEAGSFRMKGVVDYWAKDYLELVEGLQVTIDTLGISRERSGAISLFEAWQLGVHIIRWLRCAATASSTDDIRVSLRLLKGLSAITGFRDILGLVDDLVVALGGPMGLDGALGACMNLYEDVADVFERQGMTAHHHVLKLAGNFELYLYYLALDVNAGGALRVASMDQFLRAPLSDQLRNGTAQFFDDAVAYINLRVGSAQTLMTQGLLLTDSIAKHLRNAK